MRDQVEAASRAGVRAAMVNSANVTEWDEIRTRLEANELDVLLVALNASITRRSASSGCRTCCRAWGCSLLMRRTVFLTGATISAPTTAVLVRSLDLCRWVPVLATTATANDRVSRDIAEQLSTDTTTPVHVLRGPLSRKSLRLGVLTLPHEAQRIGWLLTHLNSPPGSGIIYTLTGLCGRRYRKCSACQWLRGARLHR